VGGAQYNKDTKKWEVVLPIQPKTPPIKQPTTGDTSAVQRNVRGLVNQEAVGQGIDLKETPVMVDPSVLTEGFKLFSSALQTEGNSMAGIESVLNELEPRLQFNPNVVTNRTVIPAVRGLFGRTTPAQTNETYTTNAYIAKLLPQLLASTNAPATNAPATVMPKSTASLPPPEQRPKGFNWTTSKGTFVWNGTGWDAVTQ
jgi:hypothetical protein